MYSRVGRIAEGAYTSTSSSTLNLHGKPWHITISVCNKCKQVAAVMVATARIAVDAPTLFGHICVRNILTHTHTHTHTHTSI